MNFRRTTRSSDEKMEKQGMNTRLAEASDRSDTIHVTVRAFTPLPQSSITMVHCPDREDWKDDLFGAPGVAATVSPSDSAFNG